ncbi:FecCD family ABC transporter permease [Actinorugispora endophytica]|uniref:Iron complex transport system permease protein n=1 Tax=Actinorugispora endophytica TaxID=1605990 RepID=A0A4R6UWS8_9ACTN|nr:iron chelate uptake ABC transporter family permease subunit [Actinorugispora endophytica]TDQ50726.1 iron complex transport system permease protein [Actinorugispora endophytica]
MSAPPGARGGATGYPLRAGDRLSLRVDARSAAVCAVLLAALAALGTLALATGEFRLSAAEVLAALAGRGDPGHAFIVVTLRLPRLLTALLVGAALAVSGGLLQRLSGNPLGSPDIIGFTNGAATGALTVIVVTGGSMLAIAAGALVGGVATAAAIYLLAFTRGVRGSRFVLVGIGISAMTLAVNSYLITRAEPQDALAAQAWLVGSVNGRGWPQALAVGAALAVLLPIALHHGRALTMLEMGDDTARSLGVGVERARLALVVVSVLLSAIATAATGPILFVALAAPQLARRLTRSSGPGLVPTALMGALLLVAGDFAVQQRVLVADQLPVGTATGLLGGLYFVWLLASQRRGGRP